MARTFTGLLGGLLWWGAAGAGTLSPDGSVVLPGLYGGDVAWGDLNGDGALALVRSHLDGGRRAVHDLVRALDPNVIALPREESKALVNVNTPSDYEALR